jgi:hypothetical protein
VLAVGYRVRSPRGTQFRRWATTRLEEYVKGFTLDDERLKQPAGAGYFDELLERIRDIRTSEARVYQRIREIFRREMRDTLPGPRPRSARLRLHWPVPRSAPASRTEAPLWWVDEFCARAARVASANGHGDGADRLCAALVAASGTTPSDPSRAGGRRRAGELSAFRVGDRVVALPICCLWLIGRARHGTTASLWLTDLRSGRSREDVPTSTV